MKKLVLLCAALFLMSGCSKPAESQSPAPSTTSQNFVPPSETVTLPGSTASPAVTESLAPEPTLSAEPTATPAVTESPAPEETSAPGVWDGDLENLTLDLFPAQLTDSAALAQGSDPLYLIAELPDLDTWLYGIGDQDRRVILRIGGDWQCFDITYLFPGYTLPTMAYGDFDGDLNMELALLFHADYGDSANVSVDTLHVVEFDPAGLWSDQPFNVEDYVAILEQSVLYAYDAASRTVTLQIGEQALSHTIPQDEADYAGPYSFGKQVDLFLDGDAIRASFGAAITHANSSTGDYIASVSADVVYTGSTFGLNNLYLQAG